jgi:hypothetical protein
MANPLQKIVLLMFFSFPVASERQHFSQGAQSMSDCTKENSRLANRARASSSDPAYFIFSTPSIIFLVAIYSEKWIFFSVYRHQNPGLAGAIVSMSRPQCALTIIFVTDSLFRENLYI